MTKEIQLYNGHIAIVDDDDFDILSKYKYHLCGGYAQRTYRIFGIPKNIYMHHEVVKLKHGYEIDHINGNKLDNRKENLRSCTHAQNQTNQKLSIRNKSGYRGVSYNKTTKKWIATIKINGEYIFLGNFDTPELAAKKYDEVSVLHHGDFGIRNFPINYNDYK